TRTPTSIPAGWPSSRGLLNISSFKEGYALNSYLLKLGGPLADAGMIKADGSLAVALSKSSGTDDSGQPAKSCKVDTDKTPRFISETEGRFQPAYIRYSKAGKALSPTSL